ncbi:MAG: ATP/GTP-binding protein [Candidatus Bathyarchaeota archaeon]|nr:ATP/GTP-binding protein [Candidatus Bathyarchaeota archaeon]
MNLVFILGTAGSGKSTFTAKFTRYLEFNREDVMAVNLDPGSIILPYAANVNIRDYIKVEELMEDYGLGPNGGLMLAHDMMAEIVEDLSNDIEGFTPDVVLVDTPGQMELFAFRNIGAQIAQNLTDSEKGVIYLFDGVICKDPLNYVMNMFLASAINTRFLLPQFQVISKTDLLESYEVEEIVSWSEDSMLLEQAIDSRVTGMNRTISQDMIEVINRLGVDFAPIPVSSTTNEGFNYLYAELLRVFTDGGKFTP